VHIDLLVCLNHHGLEINLPDLKNGGIVMHVTPDWQFPPDKAQLIEDKKLQIMYVPVEKLLAELGAKPILANTLLTAIVWKILDQKVEPLKDLIRERFGKKKQEIVDQNIACIDAGLAFAKEHFDELAVALPKPKASWKKDML